MKLMKWLGIFSACLLIVACFIPWTYHPDLQKEFTGFFSEEDVYGRPGLFFVAFASLSVLLFLIPRLWAKRLNIFVTALVLAFAIRCFMIFSGCYVGVCPEKKAGIYIMLFSAIAIFICSLFPDLKLRKDENING